MEERISREENLRLWRRWKKGDLKARNELILKNVGLIFLFLGCLPILYFRRLGITEEEIKAELSLALVKAVEHWDPQKGTLSTYAFYAFRSAVPVLIDKSREIHFDWESPEEFRRLQRILEELKSNPNNLSFDRIAQRMRTPSKQVKKLLMMKRGVQSLDKPLADSNMFLLDIIPELEVPLEEQVLTDIEKEERKKIIHKALKMLNKREQFVLEGYFGLNGSKKTLKEIGILLAMREGRKRPISKQGVAQIKDRALEKLKKYILAFKHQKIPCPL